MVGHVVVIGAGVYGAAVAAALRGRGVTVTVVDSGVPGGGTSGATFSWLNSCGKQPRAYHDLNVAGMVAHRRLAAANPRSDWYHEGGNLEWADGNAGPLRAKVAGLLDYGYDAQWLTRAEVSRLEPDLDPAVLPADGIAYFPGEGWLDPARMIAFLLAEVDVVRGDAVTGFDIAGGRVRAVRLGSGLRLGADAVVNCAGPRAADVAALAGLALPMRNTSGTLVHTSPVAAAVGRVVHAPHVHLRPAGAGRLLLHSHETDGTEYPDAIERLLAAARALYPDIGAATADSVRVGERPIPGDGLPVLGRAPELPNFHFAVSHSGATLSVYAGDLVAGEALGEDHDDVLAPFRFERFAL